jgi:hypothetical protein
VSARPVMAVPHRVAVCHADITPEAYWSAVDSWLERLGHVDATWAEVAGHYATRAGVLFAVRAVIDGREVEP